MKKNKAIAYIDGACRGNPGLGAYGVVIHWNGETYQLCGYLEETTNNIAEYMAFLALLDWAIDNAIQELQVYTDSQLLAKQIHGQYRIKAKHLQKLFLQAQEKMKSLRRVVLHHIPREKNKLADALANEVLDRYHARKME